MRRSHTRRCKRFAEDDVVSSQPPDNSRLLGRGGSCQIAVAFGQGVVQGGGGDRGACRLRRVNDQRNCTLFTIASYVGFKWLKSGSGATKIMKIMEPSDCGTVTSQSRSSCG